MAEEIPFDAGDQKAVEKQRKTAKQDSLERTETIKKIMGMQDVRKWLFEVLTWTGIGRNPFSSDAMLMSHSCGEMNIGLQIRSAIETAAPELYLQMMRENNNG